MDYENMTDPEDLRRPPSQFADDLRDWQLQERRLNDDTSTVLAWADPIACMLHEASCNHGSEHHWTHKMRMSDAVALFPGEQAGGDLRSFGFCGHCLVERIPWGRSPTQRFLKLHGTMRTLLNDIKIDRRPPIERSELVRTMSHYPSGSLTMKELDYLLEWDRRENPGSEDLTRYIVNRARRA